MLRGLLRRGLPLVVFFLLLIVFITSGLAGADPSSMDRAATHTSSQSVYGVQIDPDNVLLQVDLRPDGSGEWRVEYRIRLDDENSTEAFERHREEIESNPDTYRDRFATDMRATINNAENTTGREMSLTNVTIDVTRERLPQEYGIIVYTFEWNGFAATTGSTIEAGDALEGIFLDSETTLIVTWPAEYHRMSVSPPPHEVRDRGIVWSGSMHFAADEPRIVVSQEGTATTPTTGGDQDETTDAGSTNGSDGESPLDGNGRQLFLPILIGAVVVILGGLGGAVYLGFIDLPLGGSTTASAGSDSVSDLMSNEEQVQTILEEHGGRLKQQEVAAKLDWTDAKTSKVIRQMCDGGSIETFRLGRENVVTLPDTDLDE